MNSWALMYDLADTLYMTLRADAKGVITALPYDIKVTFGRLEMRLRPSIVASFRTENVLGVVVRIAGDFHIYLTVEEQDAGDIERHLYAFTTGKGNALERLKNLPRYPDTPETICAALRPSLVAYARRFGRNLWERMDTGDHGSEIHQGSDATKQQNPD